MGSFRNQARRRKRPLLFSIMRFSQSVRSLILHDLDQPSAQLETGRRKKNRGLQQNVFTGVGRRRFASAGEYEKYSIRSGDVPGETQGSLCRNQLCQHGCDTKKEAQPDPLRLFFANSGCECYQRFRPPLRLFLPPPLSFRLA